MTEGNGREGREERRKKDRKMEKTRVFLLSLLLLPSYLTRGSLRVTRFLGLHTLRRSVHYSRGSIEEDGSLEASVCDRDTSSHILVEQEADRDEC